MSSKEGTADEEDSYIFQINAKEKGNFTRFINHSSLEDNVRTRLIKLPEKPTPAVLLVAKKTIFPGEQFLAPYWNSLDIIPNDTLPSTLTLDTGDNLQLSHAFPSALSEEVKTHLLSLRTPLDAADGNVSLRLVFEEETNELHYVLIAEKPFLLGPL